MFTGLFLILSLFSLPFQFGTYFWLPGSSVFGLSHDLLAFRLTLTDLFILGFLAASFKQLAIVLLNNRRSGLLWSLLLLATCSLISSPLLLTFLHLLKIGLYILYAVTVTKTSNFRSIFRCVLYFQIPPLVLLALYQFLNQHSLNGLAYYLGERLFDSSTLQLANINQNFLGQHLQFIRPPSTFSHPNSFAGYLHIIFLYTLLNSGQKLIKTLCFLGILLSFSKSALLGLIIYFLLSYKISKKLKLLLVLPLITLISVNLSQSINYRLEQINNLKKIPFSKQIIGTGYQRSLALLAQYTPTSQKDYYYLQPIHNVLLLYFFEFGFFGLVIAYLNRQFFQNLFHGTIAISLLPTLLLDHYWWTLSQNQLIILIIFTILTYEQTRPDRNSH